MPRRIKKPAPPEGKAERKKLGAALTGIATRFAGFRPARETLKPVRAVPTMWPQVDHAIGVGGWPTERNATIHGPSNEGKTLFTFGLELSFLEREHFVLHVDAERTSPITWVRALMGPLADSDRFFATRPDTYEQCVDEVRNFCETIEGLRGEKKIHADTCGLIVVDSLRKLVPENILAKIKRHGAEGEKGSVDGMSGRAAMIRAAMNAAWLDELVPLLERTGCAFVAIARESEDPNASADDVKYGRGYKVQGGKALIYDASLVVRIDRDAGGWIKEGSEKNEHVVGERHRVTIKKTKVSERDEKEVLTFFHSLLSPAAFDFARDLIHFGVAVGVVRKSDSGRPQWRGQTFPSEARFALHLRNDPGELSGLRAEITEAMAEVLPETVEPGENRS